MLNLHYTKSQENTISKIKSAAKAELTEWFLSMLKENVGEENVKMIRTGDASPKNDIAARCGTITTEDGEEIPLYFSFSPTIKDWEDRKTQKSFYPAFDFEAAANAYAAKYKKGE